MLLIQLLTGLCLYAGIGRYACRVYLSYPDVNDTDALMGAILWPLSVPIVFACHVTDIIFDHANKDK